MTNVNRIKVVVLGGPRVGKSAVVVRYLTRRYIGEYSSTSDFLYRHSVTIDNVTTEVEILDTSRCEGRLNGGKNYNIISRRAISDRRLRISPSADRRLFARSVFFFPPEVCVDEGQQLSLAHGCQFYEVSAAESPAGAALAFQALLREARSVQLLRALPIRRKLGVHSVSRVLGTIFGKNTTKDRKKRPSLSI
ncbi:hypothetical protein ACFW04_005326 [Cataglyphis niger]